MVAYKFNHVCLESWGLNLPPHQVSSAELEDKLAPLYKRLEIPFGTLEKLTAIKTRHFWDKSVMPSQAATVAARNAVDGIGFAREHIQALFSCSVTRDYFEPAVAALVHGALGLDERAVTMDITNACIGFSNGLLTLANLIETGVVKAGVVVSAENVASIIDSSVTHLLSNNEITRDMMLRILPTFTLGCGSVSIVLCHESIATRGHKLKGAVSRSATQHSELCVGNADFCAAMPTEGLNPIMQTDSQLIISSAAKLGARIWPDASQAFGWKAADINRIFCHQVGKQLNAGFFREMGLSNEHEFIVYPRYGNQVSAALPTALVTGITEKPLNRGDKVLLTAFGSGLNGIFTAIEW